MKKRFINDLDQFTILEYQKKKNIEGLKSLQELMIGAWGSDEECLLYSDLANFKEHKRKEPIKFPFIKDGKII